MSLAQRITNNDHFTEEQFVFRDKVNTQQHLTVDLPLPCYETMDRRNAVRKSPTTRSMWLGRFASWSDEANVYMTVRELVYLCRADSPARRMRRACALVMLKSGCVVTGDFPCLSHHGFAGMLLYQMFQFTIRKIIECVLTMACKCCIVADAPGKWMSFSIKVSLSLPRQLNFIQLGWLLRPKTYYCRFFICYWLMLIFILAQYQLVFSR